MRSATALRARRGARRFCPHEVRLRSARTIGGDLQSDEVNRFDEASPHRHIVEAHQFKWLDLEVWRRGSARMCLQFGVSCVALLLEIAPRPELRHDESDDPGGDPRGPRQPRCELEYEGYDSDHRGHEAGDDDRR